MPIYYPKLSITSSCHKKRLKIYRIREGISLLHAKNDTLFGFNKAAFKKYFFNTGWLFAEKILRMAVGLFVGVWVARYLGPTKFGLLSYAQSFVALFAAVSTLGLDQILVRELVKNPDQERELLGTAFVLRLLGATATLGILTIAVNFTSNDAYTNALIFIIGSATVFQAFKVIDLYFQAKVISKYAVLANMISVSVSSLVKIILILYNAPLIDFAWVVLFDSCVLAMGYMYFFKKRTASRLQFLKIRTNIAFSLLKNSWPLIISGLAVTIYMRIDQVMIKNMLDNRAVGQYAAAIRLSEIWYVIPVVTSSSLFPAIINAKRINEELYYDRLQRLYELMLILSLSIVLPMSLLSNPIVKLLYGVQYNDAAEVLMVHIWAAIFVFLGCASSRWLLAENLQIFSLFNTGIGAITNIALNYFLIKIWGIVGAAWATLLSYSVSAYLSLLFWKQTRRNFIMLSKSLLFTKLTNA